MEPDYTVELFKRDSRTKLGERLVAKLDHKVTAREHLEVEYAALYPAAKGYRFTIHQTFVTRKNLLSGQEFQERYDTPSFCSPSSETYWSA
jgi:hypothetical protein